MNVTIPVQFIPLGISAIGCIVSFAGMLMSGGNTSNAITWGKTLCIFGAIAIVSVAFIAGSGAR